MTYAFIFDASACTGCKACQVACKDKNNLPAGVLWRRVFEVSGGEWQEQGNAWENSVFAYNLSIACNHCVHPKCAGVCPTDAFVQREDGIVYIDGSKCMGCGYCAWACPYNVPQYNPDLGHMTKCNFCMDELDQGKPPACVAACPMRVLDFVEVSSNQYPAFSGEYQRLWEIPATEHPFPLPAFSRTQPHLAIKPHPAMGNGLEKAVANREEVKPPRPNVWRRWSPKSPDFGLEELPLVAFTLLAQMAVGAFFWLELLYLAFLNYWDVLNFERAFDSAISQVSNLLTQNALFSLGPLLAIAGLASLLHLKKPLNAWRAINHLKKSWLSREILWFGLFCLGWAATLTAQMLFADTFREPLAWATLGAGTALLYAMACVYRLRAVPAWNTWRTQAAFFISALLLGRALVFAVLAFDSLFMQPAYRVESFSKAGWLLLALLAAETWLALSGPPRTNNPATQARVGLLLLASLGALAMPFAPYPLSAWLNFPIFLLLLAQAIIGRWQFYELRQPAL
jgi:anaerobic dimethyl sulfoxide reductase subunit B (iron-sulfur subunit)